MSKAAKICVRPGWNAYERQRLQNIQKCRAKMNALGLHKAANSLRSSIENNNQSNLGKRRNITVEDDEEYRQPEYEESLHSSSDDDEYDHNWVDESYEVAPMTSKLRTTHFPPIFTSTNLHTKGPQSQHVQSLHVRPLTAPVSNMPTQSCNIGIQSIDKRVRGRGEATNGETCINRNDAISREDAENRSGNTSAEADTRKKVDRKGRGPTRNLKLVKEFKGQKFPITWTNRRPVGRYASLFKAECTALVRLVNNVPLQVKCWREVPLEKKKKLFDHISERFSVEGQENLVWEQMNKSYKNYRNSLKTTYYNPYADNPEEARENVPPKFANNPQDWDYLVDLWSHPDFQKMCEKNKENRSKNHIVHTTGSKSFQQRREEWMEETGQEIGRVHFFEISHVRSTKSKGQEENDVVQSNGQALNEETQQALDKFRNLTAQVVEGSLQMSDDQMFVEVFGSERHGRVRGYGAGVTPTQLWGSSSTMVRDLQKQLQESEEKRKESNLEIATLKTQISCIEDVLAQVMSRLPPLATHSNETTKDI